MSLIVEEKMLKLNWCDFKSANYACKNWHYSKSMPAGKSVKIGVWEDGKFVGCIIYSRGANNNQAKHFRLGVDELCELSRVALTRHKNPVSKMLSISLKMLKKICPKIKLIFSYADETNQGHKGGIYKADNWEYLGKRIATSGHLILNGKLTHNRSISSKYGSKKNIPTSIKIEIPPPQVKHLFIKRLCVSSLKVKPQSFQIDEGGAVPTDTLQKKPFICKINGQDYKPVNVD